MYTRTSDSFRLLVSQPAAAYSRKIRETCVANGAVHCPVSGYNRERALRTLAIRQGVQLYRLLRQDGHATRTSFTPENVMSNAPLCASAFFELNANSPHQWWNARAHIHDARCLRSKHTQPEHRRRHALAFVMLDRCGNV